MKLQHSYVYIQNLHLVRKFIGIQTQSANPKLSSMLPGSKMKISIPVLLSYHICGTVPLP